MISTPEEITDQFSRLNNSKWVDLNNKDIIGICRISGGKLGQSLSIPPQTENITKFLIDKNIKPKSLDFINYQCSARDIDEQKEMIKSFEENKKSAFIFSCIDRFTRDRDSGHILDECKKRKQVLVFVDEELRSDYKEDERQINNGIFESFKEGEKITERNIRNALWRKENPGKCTPRTKQPPCGYTIENQEIKGITKKIMVSNEKERVLSKVVKILKYGGSATYVNKFLIAATGNKRHALYDVHTDKLLSEIPTGMMSQQQIVNFFATFNEEDVPITYRGKPITKLVISKLLKI